MINHSNELFSFSLSLSLSLSVSLWITKKFKTRSFVYLASEGKFFISTKKSILNPIPFQGPGHSPGSLCCRTFLWSATNQQEEWEKCCCEPMAYEILGDVKPLNCWYTLIFTGHLRIRTYLTMLPATSLCIPHQSLNHPFTSINHWVVSPLWDMLESTNCSKCKGRNSLPPKFLKALMCFESNNKTIQSHLLRLHQTQKKSMQEQPFSFTFLILWGQRRSMIMVLKSAMQLAALISSKKTKTSTYQAP